MRLTKLTSDAIKILAQCTQQSAGLTKVADIAAASGLTRQMALRIANQLSQTGFVETVRGPCGGIRLTTVAQTATLGDVVRALEQGPSAQTGSRMENELEGAVDEAYEAFLAVLDQQRLQDLSA